MGRELRRVPMDFDWPLNKVWDGYLLPAELRLPQCSGCDGSGYGPEARAIANTFYSHMIGGHAADALAWCDKIGQDEVDNLVANGRLWDFWREVKPGQGWVDKDPPHRPTAAEVNAAQRGRGLIGHDAINRMILVRFRCERLGIILECPTCDGQGTVGTDEQRTAEEAWESTDPPVGEGFQLWETTSEGSPQTPVFATLDELCAYAATHCTTFGSARASAEDWRRMLDEDFVRSEWQGPDGSRHVFI